MLSVRYTWTCQCIVKEYVHKHACPMQISKRQFGRRESGFFGGRREWLARTTGALVLQEARSLCPILTL